MTSTASAGTAERGTRMFVALCALLSVSPLLAWVSGLGRFSLWTVAVAIPAITALGGVTAWLHRGGRYPGLRDAIAVGAFGGLVGTLGYDLFRVPFAALGLRLLAPIDSYGVLLLDARASNTLTGLAGWGYHFTNGICFGIAYAAVAYRRPYWWAIGWAMVLETATVLTPFADTYGLRGRYDLIAVAYAAHVFYGLPLGIFAQRGSETVAQLREVSRRTVLYVLAALVVALFVWHRPAPPFSTRPEATIVDGKLSPAWLRVAPHGCATVRNTDSRSYRIAAADGAPRVAAGATARLCFTDKGVHRVRTSDRPWSGGFVIVDGELAA